jgi:hypothetical protein
MTSPSSPVPAVEVGESAADYERRCSFDQPALDLARHLEAVFVSEPKRLRVTKAQIAITELLMASTATPTPGRAAEPDTMGEVENRICSSDSDDLPVHALLSRTTAAEDALRHRCRPHHRGPSGITVDRSLRAETAEAQLATLRAQPAAPNGKEEIIDLLRNASALLNDPETDNWTKLQICDAVEQLERAMVVAQERRALSTSGADR